MQLYQMNFFEAVEKRFSCRSLQPVDIPQADVLKILDAGRRAASGHNTQPFDFLVVKEKEHIQALAAAQAFIGEASVVIGIIAHPEKSQFWLEDISAAAENMLLAITALGYGSTWIEGTFLRKEGEMKRHFGVPDSARFMIVLPIGKPAKDGVQRPKKSLDELIHWDSW